MIEELHEERLERQLEGVAHGVLAKSLGTDSFTLMHARKEILTEGDFYKSPSDGKVYYTQSGEIRLRVHFDQNNLVPRFENVRVIRQTQNSRWVWAMTEDKKRVPMAIPKKMKDKLNGKIIRAEVIKDGDGKKTYRHEILAR